MQSVSRNPQKAALFWRMSIRIVFYDISDDKHRTKLAHKLRAWGFERIQYSVFCGRHSPFQWQKCWKEILAQAKKYGDGTEKIYTLIISRQQLENMEHIGEKPDLSIALNERITLWV